MFDTGMSKPQILASVQARLLALRIAFDSVAQLYRWSSGVSTGDLQAIGFSAPDAALLLSAIADANAEVQVHWTGLPPPTYPQPASAYPYGASQAQVIGPQ